MTYSTLAAVVKYPFSSAVAGKKQKFGFFKSEEKDFVPCAEDLGMKRLSSDHEPLRYARHPLVFLVEAADDICYQLMDLEDACKLKILTAETTKELLLAFLPEERRPRVRSICNMVTDTNEQIAYLRSSAIVVLVKACTDVFVEQE